MEFKIENSDIKLLAIKESQVWSEFIENQNDDVITYPGFFRMSGFDTYIILRENTLLAFKFKSMEFETLFEAREYHLGGEKIRYNVKELLLLGGVGIVWATIQFQNHTQVDMIFEHFSQIKKKRST